MVQSQCYVYFNAPPTAELYTLSLHDALPIFDHETDTILPPKRLCWQCRPRSHPASRHVPPLLSAVLRSEEHTSELQSLAYLVCRLLLEKKKKITLDAFSLLLISTLHSNTSKN